MSFAVFNFFICSLLFELNDTLIHFALSEVIGCLSYLESASALPTNPNLLENNEMWLD